MTQNKDKVVLVTGCSSGVGLQIAVLLAKENFKVYATMRNLAKSQMLKETAKNADVFLNILKLDVQNENSIKDAVDSILSKEKRIDILINNAGFGSVCSLEQCSFNEIENIMDVNFYGAVRCIRAVLPAMREQKSGHIISISSVGGLVGQPLNEIYCAAKFALEGLIESMATYMEPYFNIKMTLIEPAGIRSEFINNVRENLQSKPAPLQDVYGPILKTYIETTQKRGAFENSAQTSVEVAESILECILNSSADLRVQTSEIAKKFVEEKITADPTGTHLQKRIRQEFLNL